MGTNPTKAADNIYCKCRKEAAKYNDRLNSREGAAEMLGISLSSLADYELGNTRPPIETVNRMAEIYGTPELRSRYCSAECPLGEGVFPAVTITGLDRVALRTLKALKGADTGLYDALLEITHDGVIHEHEKPILKEIFENLEDIAHCYHEFKLWAEKNRILE